MSKGPGHIQRAILAAFEAEPDNAFTTVELCERAYPDDDDGLGWQKKHRIAVIRAAKKIAKLRCLESEMLGRQLVFYDPCNVMSYAMARLKADFINNYRNDDPRYLSSPTTEADLRKKLADARHQKLVAKGGAWWLHTELAKAQARGDRKRAAQVQKQIDRDLERLAAGLRSGSASGARR
jgi:hypothetical protein